MKISHVFIRLLIGRDINMTDHDKLEEWFYRYVDDIYNFLIYFTGRKDVEDIVQEVFLKLIRKGNLENIEKPKTFLFSIAKNAAIDDVRKRKKIIFSSPEELNLVSGENLPEETLLAQEDYHSVLKPMHELKRNYRVVLILRLVNELSFEEIAEALHWKVSKVKTTYYRALHKYKQTLNYEGEVKL